MWKRLLAHFTRRETPAARLYAAIVAQARQPVFYARAGVPDTVMGRFGMVALHVILVLERLREEGGGEPALELMRLLQEEMFADMDASMREMGVSDLGVPKRMRKLADAFYGQMTAYGRALGSDARAELARALARNVFADARGDAADERTRAVMAGADMLAVYAMRALKELRAQSREELEAGRVAWPSLMEGADGGQGGEGDG